MSHRSEALAAGAVTYNTGYPCRHGHYSDRYTTSGNCLTCITATQIAKGAKSRRRPPMSGIPEDWTDAFDALYMIAHTGTPERQHAVKHALGLIGVNLDAGGILDLVEWDGEQLMGDLTTHETEDDMLVQLDGRWYAESELMATLNGYQTHAPEVMR